MVDSQWQADWDLYSVSLFETGVVWHLMFRNQFLNELS
jgi:hypothetical protein